MAYYLLPRTVDVGPVVKVQQQDEGAATVIAMAGDLGCEAAGELREATARAANAHGRVVIEMTGVTGLSIPVVGALVSAWHTLDDRLTLRCSAPVYAALARTGLDRLLPVA